MITCTACGTTKDTDRQRGGPAGLPAGWVSAVGVTHDFEGLDSVNHAYSGTYCSYECWAAGPPSIHLNTFSERNSVRPEGLPPVQETIEETREMQATRIGLTVLDILDVLLNDDNDYGALIPLTAEYEGLPHTCMLTVAKITENDAPEMFQLLDEEAISV